MGIKSNNPTEAYYNYFSDSGKDAVGAAPPGATSATGGFLNDYESGGTWYRSHIFLNPGTFEVTEGTATCNYLVIGGGGGGGNSNGGGGGAGTVLYGEGYTATKGSYTVQAGGGGAGAVGSNGTTSSAGNGGNGVASTITGSSVTRAGGGGGGFYRSSGAADSYIGTGGTGGGGNGAVSNGQTLYNNAPEAGTANTGSGGGGRGEHGASGSPVSAGNGGSGVVIVRYPSQNTISVGDGLTATTSTDGDYKVTTFSAGTGTVSWQ